MSLLGDFFSYVTEQLQVSWSNFIFKCDSNLENPITVNCVFGIWKKNSVNKASYFYILPTFVCLYENITALQSNVSKIISKISGFTRLWMHYMLSSLSFQCKRSLYEVFWVLYFPRKVNYQAEGQRESNICITLCGFITLYIEDLPHMFTNVLLSLLCVSNILMHNFA